MSKEARKSVVGMGVAAELSLSFDGSLEDEPLAEALLAEALHRQFEVLAADMDDGDGLIHMRPKTATKRFRAHLEKLAAPGTLHLLEAVPDLWDPSESWLSIVLGAGVWEGRLLPELMTSGMAHPAIPSLIIPDLARLLAGPLEVVPTGVGGELRTRRRAGHAMRRVAQLITTPSAPDLHFDSSAANALGDINIQRWLRTQVHTTWHQRILGNTTALEVLGGYRALLKRIEGPASGKAAARLKKGLHLLRHVVLPKPPNAGPLIELTETRAEHARVQIELAGPLSMGFANEMKGMGIRNRRLVPLPRELPPFGGLQTNRHSAACAFQMLLLTLVRDGAEELLDGSVHLAPEALHAQGELVALPPRDIDHLMALWCHGDDRLLTHVGQDEYDIGPRRVLMRRFLIEGAEASRMGRLKRARPKRERAK